MSLPYHHSDSSKPVVERSAEDTMASIPQPPMHWVIGNAAEMDPKFPASSIWRLADLYGPIFKLNIVGREFLVLSNFELINEVMDDDRFEKYVGGGLEQVRALAGDGLFTAYGNEPNWGKAHRILIPVFGPLAIRKMFPEMLDIGSQLILKWDRMGPDHEIEISDDFTRLAFDTIGLCAFSYRFNDFYRDDVHPFATQMAETLVESGKRASRTWVENHLRIWSAQHTQENINAMWGLCDQLVAERKAYPQPDNRDLLNTMLTATDPETGEKMSDENIRFNMVTFLIAGHETTSGTLSFMMYHLCKNPEKFLKAQAEVDKVVGDAAIDLKHLPQLKYVEACIRETLRFMGPISVITRHAKKDTVLGVKYPISSKMPLQFNLMALHHDPKIWGDDHDVFRPERFLNGGFEALPPNAWRPFGFGVRSCIGKAFAEQEMLMVAALIFQRFQIEAADPSYDLRIKSTLTIKPEGFKMKVRRRPGKSNMVGIPGAPSSVHAIQQTTSQQADKGSVEGSRDKPKLLILYGSNAGTCKALAEDLLTTANNRAGYDATAVTMDHATEHLPADGTPVVIITPSYEGKPADNAKKFVTWLELSESEGKNNLKGLKYAVFGAGNSEWVTTFHRIPKLVDELASKLGGTRICPAGYVDVRGDIVGPWEDFTAGLFPALSKATGVEQKLEEEEIKIQFEKAEHAKKLAGEEIDHGYVKKNVLIATNEVGPAKKHMEVELPVGTTYQTGDYLVVLPINLFDEIKRACLRFKLHVDDTISISGTSKSFLSTNKGPITIAELLGTRVELGTPVSQRQLEVIAKTASDENERKELEELASDSNYKEGVLAKRMSVLDILDDYPSCKLDFAAFLDMLKPLSPRQYSISSSPLAKMMEPDDDSKPVIATITYDVHKAPARSGHNRIFKGVASTYLSDKDVGGKLRCFVRPTNAAFHLPPDPETPVIMVAAGTGIAPMRGFIQERACLAAAGRKKLGPAILYFGCRDADKDFIYKDELKKWEEAGVVEVRPAFSQHGPEGGYKYVPDRIWAERDELAKLFKDGAKIFLCGSASKLAKSSNEVIKKIYLEKNPGKTDEDAFEWLQKQREERYVTDVFD